MKVAYNNCFGGFSLSPVAEHEYRKKKGILLTWYQGDGNYPYENFVRVDNVDSINPRTSFNVTASTKDLGPTVDKIPEDCHFFESWHEDENRSDPDLIEVVERLGEKANGRCAKIAIKEIPDGAEFEITEYDGSEDVVPPRMSW